jgi:sRNA-binding regulator protein Hfq
MINGQLLREGEQIDGYRIKTIDRFQILLESEGGDQVLKLKGEQSR